MVTADYHPQGQGWNTVQKHQVQERNKRHGLIPHPKKVGQFVKQVIDPTDTGLKFLDPSNWVFHDKVVDKVINGNYSEITPYSAEFMPTMNCFHRCKIPCAFEKVKKDKGIWEKNNYKDPEAHMQGDDFGLLEKLVDGGVKGFIWTGGGDPTLYKNLPALMQRATDLGTDSVLYTNGAAITDSFKQAILDAQPLLVRVSLNAGTKEVYDELHQPFVRNAFNRTLDTITYFAEHANGTDVGVAVVINEINAHDLVQAAYRVKKIQDETGGVKYVTFRPAFNYNGPEQLQPDLLNFADETVEEHVRPVLESSGVSVSNLRMRYEALKEYKQYPCNGTGLYGELGPDGDLYLCCDKTMNKQFAIGSLHEQSLSEVYKSDKRFTLLDYVDKFQEQICPHACKPHETNKQFAQVESLRSQGKMYMVESWIEAHQAGPVPRMVNF